MNSIEAYSGIHGASSSHVMRDFGLYSGSNMIICLAASKIADVADRRITCHHDKPPLNPTENIVRHVLVYSIFGFTVLSANVILSTYSDYKLSKLGLAAVTGSAIALRAILKTT